MTVDLLVAGVANRPDHPRVVSVFPEGWEDIDVNLSGGERLFVQAKERAPESQNLGAAGVADAIVHAAVGMSAAGELGGGARIAIVTDCTLGSGLIPTGWAATLLESSTSGVLATLDDAVKGRLGSAGLDPGLSSELLGRTSIVCQPWNHSQETQNDLASAYAAEPAVAWLAFAVLVERVSRIAAEQRSSSVDAAVAITATDLNAIVDTVAAAVDVASLNEAVIAGVCAPVDFLGPSDLSARDFLAGVDTAPSHIAAGLDITRERELAAILDALGQRHHVLIAGPSGSGKSALLWRTAQTLTLGARVLRVFRVASDEDLVVLIRHVQRTKPSQNAPVVLCVDNVGSPSMSMWPSGLERVLELPGVYVISTARREDYLPSLAFGAVVVDSLLAKESAEAIFAALLGAEVSTALEVEEAVERADGLLMEFIALVTTGQRLRDVLEAQIQPLRTAERSLDRNALRLVCAAHSLGWSIDAGRLAALLSPADPSLVGDSLSRLEGEHLVIQDLALGSWRGIHDLRAEIIQEILHASPPPTLGATMCEAVLLLAPVSRPRAIVRAAELLARDCADDPAGQPTLERLVAALWPLAELARALLADDDVRAEEVATYCAALLQAAIRLDAIAYACATLPLIEDSCPPTLDVSTLGWLLYAMRVDHLAFPGGSEPEEITALARTLPPFDSQLSEAIAHGIDSARLIDVAGSAGLDRAAEFLEAAEGFIELDSTQARAVWQRLVPALPAPPGDGFDAESADLRARVASALASLAGLKGSEVAAVLGPVQERADDAIACDADAAAVCLRFEPHNAADDAGLPVSPRSYTWSPAELLVAETAILYRSEAPLTSGYPPQPNDGEGLNRRLVGACRRLLDACPEVDRADVSGVAANWKPIGYGSMVFGRKTIRSGVLRVAPAVRRNVAYQAAVARMRMAESWSARLRQQAALASEIAVLLTELPRRLRAHDNERRARQWAERVTAAQASASALPRRPSPSPRAQPTDIGVVEADEASRAQDPEQEVFRDLTQGLAAASEAVESDARNRFYHGAQLLLQARTKLADARASGTPTFAAVGDALPPELDRLAAQAERLLQACAACDEARRLVHSARSDQDALARADDVAALQDSSDRDLLEAWLSSRGVAYRAVHTIPDPDPLAGRLNSNRTVAFVAVDVWATCAQALAASPTEDWGDATGRLVVLAVHDTMALPIGMFAVGPAGSWMPIVDPEDFQAIGNDLEVPVVDGPHLAEFRRTVNDLVAWSGAIELRARRPATWYAPLAASPTPVETRARLTDELRREPGANEAGRALVEGLIDLATLVEQENGSSPGLAARLVESVTTPGAASNAEAINGLAILAMAADTEEESIGSS